MYCDINLSNIIEWIIALTLGILGWFVAIKSTLSQQKKERYNNLIEDFHSFTYNFRFHYLNELIDRNNKKYIIQDINRQIKIIYFKARDLDSLNRSKIKIYDKIKKAGEEFVDSALLDRNIEIALIAQKRNEQNEIQINNFQQLMDKFLETCYLSTEFKK